MTTTRVGGTTYTRTARRAAPDGTGYFLWECRDCGALVNGAGLSLYSHAGSQVCRRRQGAACSNCGMTAVECQRHFVATDERYWCCPPCQVNGPEAMHTVPVP